MNELRDIQAVDSHPNFEIPHPKEADHILQHWSKKRSACPLAMTKIVRNKLCPNHVTIGKLKGLMFFDIPIDSSPNSEIPHSKETDHFRQQSLPTVLCVSIDHDENRAQQIVPKSRDNW